MFDFIGDIHGHADELEALLGKLGYREQSGVYRHPSRRVIFLGDFIDRGPKIQRVLQIARRMVEEGSALTVLGNHELNALAYHTPLSTDPSEFIRPHTPKNNHQHQATLNQLDTNELSEYLDWFRTLPLWIEQDGFRVIHACWDDREIKKLQSELIPSANIDDRFLERICHLRGDLYSTVETLCKGKEAPLPAGHSWADKDGNTRHHFRTRWYLPPDGLTFKQYAFDEAAIGFDRLLDPSIVSSASPYAAEEKPVFIGHYWLRADEPTLLAHNVSCLDYSVAKNGFLCAYRWDGEPILSNSNWVS